MNGEKGMLTEGGIRTPFVAYWKGTIPPGQVYPHPVIALDVAATANALSGQEEDPTLDGTNLIPYLSGEKEGAPHEAIFWRWMGQSAIRKNKWKYLMGEEREYLFNLEADVEESTNLLSKHPEVAAQLRAELVDWAGEQIPPGIDLPMSKQGSDYFDWYLDNKRAPQPTPNATPNKPVSSLFERRDRNQDEVVTFEEYLAGRTGRVGVLRRNFDRLDLNKDGRWEKAESAH